MRFIVLLCSRSAITHGSMNHLRSVSNKREHPTSAAGEKPFLARNENRHLRLVRHTRQGRYSTSANASSVSSFTSFRVVVPNEAADPHAGPDSSSIYPPVRSAAAADQPKCVVSAAHEHPDELAYAGLYTHAPNSHEAARRTLPANRGFPMGRSSWSEAPR